VEWERKVKTHIKYVFDSIKSSKNTIIPQKVHRKCTIPIKAKEKRVMGR
jgi:hypothetical protein